MLYFIHLLQHVTVNYFIFASNKTGDRSLYIFRQELWINLADFQNSVFAGYILYHWDTKAKCSKSLKKNCIKIKWGTEICACVRSPIIFIIRSIHSVLKNGAPTCNFVHSLKCNMFKKWTQYFHIWEEKYLSLIFFSS